MRERRMGTTSPQMQLPTQRQLGSAAVGACISEDEKARVNELTSGFYDAFRRALSASGGADALRARLDERESFKSDISKALNRIQDGTGQRKVPLEWLAGVAVDPEGALQLITQMVALLGPAIATSVSAETIVFLVEQVNALFGFEPPIAKRSYTPEQLNAASREVIAEMRDDEQRELMQRRIARKLGCRVEDVKL